MGATDFGNSENIYVEILSKNKLSNTNVDLDEPINDLNLQKIKVFKNAIVEDLDIEIIGKSVQQKLLSASKYSTLSEVINDLSFSDDLYPFYATIEQSGLNNLFKSKKSFYL